MNKKDPPVLDGNSESTRNNQREGRLPLPFFSSDSFVDMGAGLEIALNELEEVDLFRDLEEVFGLSIKLKNTAKLIYKLHHGAVNNLESHANDIDLCFSKGGFDLALTLPGFLNAYYSADRGLLPLKNYSAVLSMFIQKFAADRNITIIMARPLSLVSSDNRRFVSNDVHGISKLSPVVSAVRRMIINFHDDQLMVTDCPTPELSRAGTILRKGHFAIYNRSIWT